MFIRAALVGLVPLALGVQPASAQCSQWTPGFSLSGVDGSVLAVAEFDDGGGSSLILGGTMWGTTLDAEARRLVRWDGQAWTAFGLPDGAVEAIAVFDDGSGPAVYIGGQFVSIDGTTARAIAKWNGTSWSEVGGGLTGGGSPVGTHVFDLEVFDDGSGAALYCAGSFTSAGGVAVKHVARWDGSTWSSLGSGVNTPESPNYTWVSALQPFDDGSGTALFVGGNFSRAGAVDAANLARWDGAAWSAVSTGMSGSSDASVNSLAVFQGALHCGGHFDFAGGVPMRGVARWDGTAFTSIGDVTMGDGASGIVYALHAHDDGSGLALWAGGSFAEAGGVVVASLARWSGSAWSALPETLESADAPALPSVRSLRTWNDGSGSALVVAGEFERAGGLARPGVTLWRAGTFEAFGHEELGVRGEALAFARFDDGSGERLYVGGTFDYVHGEPCRNLARWDGNALHPFAQVEGWGALTSVRAFAAWDEGGGLALYVGGAFTSVDGVPANAIARWDGANWSALGTGMSGEGTGTMPTQVTSLAVFDDGSGPALYAAGKFGRAGSVQVNHVAKWNGVAWSSLGNGVEGVPLNSMPVSALAVYEGELYVGGKLIQFGGVPGPYLSRWNGSAWSAVGSGIAGAYGSTEVRSLHVADVGEGSKLFVGGTFAAAGGQATVNVAAWDGAWEALPGIAQFGTLSVCALTSFDDGTGQGPKLVAGTENFPINGASNVVWRRDGASWSPLDVGVYSTNWPAQSARASALCVVPAEGDARTDLYAGGNFRRAQGEPSHGMARWLGCGESGRTFCFGDGTSSDCPCANASAVGARAGCLNSFGTAATLRGRGVSSLSADSLTLVGGSMTNSSALYFQGANEFDGGAGVAFGDGLKCTAGPFVRLGTKVNMAGESEYPVGGDLSVSAKGLITAPGTRHYQVRYRNSAAFCTSEAFNYTNGLTLIWTL